MYKDVAITLIWTCGKCNQEIRKRVSVDLDMGAREATLRRPTDGREFWEHDCTGDRGNA